MLSAASRENHREVAARITDRDQQIVAHLGITRCLTTEQIAKLVFAGRTVEVARRRLAVLAGIGGGGAKPPLLDRQFFRTFDGDRVPVWTLTASGYARASRTLGRRLKEPSRDIGANFIEHTVALNELYVRLLARVAPENAEASARAGGAAAHQLKHLVSRARQEDFRWISSDGVQLPWREYDLHDGKTRDRQIRPDAVLGGLRIQRRYFIECEMGSHSIEARSDEKTGATIAKIERYQRFMRTFVRGTNGPTYYTQAYPDCWPAELVFLVMTPSRSNSITAVAERLNREGLKITVRALTIDAAVSFFREAGIRRHSSPVITSAPRAEVSRSDIKALKAFYGSTVEFIRKLRAEARSRNAPVPEYPEAAQQVFELVQRLNEGAAK